MYNRLLILPQKKSFFVFGARNTGKSTLIENQFSVAHTLMIDLLDSEEQMRFEQDPNDLYQIVQALPKTITHVVLDEVQKVPKLLDVVQRLMKTKDRYFIMSGSSARKLKKGGANLLAGRAFVYHLHPLTFIELGDDFNLQETLQWGALPDITHCDTDHTKRKFLEAYAHTYLKEEIWDEHIIRKLDPFRRFLEVAAQNNGKQINYSNIARDVGVDDKTVKSYYQILEDTLIGFFLEPFHHSFRKRLAQTAKFYFFDTGVVRALARLTTVMLMPQTPSYGNAFEHYIIVECIRLANYYNLDYQFSYLRTASDVEMDIVVERPGKPLLCIEIKSASKINAIDISSFIELSRDIHDAEAICLCDDKYPKQIEHVIVLPWQLGLKQYFTKQDQ